MKEQTDIVVVIPVGPTCQWANITDTIDSVREHTAAAYPFVIIDDSQNGTGKKLSDKYGAGIHILTIEQGSGGIPNLYTNLCRAFVYALDHFDFKLVLRMDTDALIIGSRPESVALRFFEENPGVGMAGTYISRRYSPDCFGNIQDNTYPRNTLLAGTCTWKFIRRPGVNYSLRKLLFRALLHGYELGANIQGGAYYISHHCLQRMRSERLLPARRLRRSILMEDHLFSLLTCATGLRLGDLGAQDGPFACRWKGLPAAPECLLVAGKKIIHSVRFWGDMPEPEIRLYFRNHRNNETRL